MSTINIRQWPAAFLTNRKKTILEAALKEGIPYPHGCRPGKCGSCKTQLFKGEVSHAPYFEEAFSVKRYYTTFSHRLFRVCC